MGKKQWGSHSFIDPLTKEFIRRLRLNNVPLGRVCSIVNQKTGDSSGAIRKQTIRNLCTKLAQEDIQQDITKTVELLNSMKREDKDFEVRFNLNSEGRIEVMLWCTGRNKMDYKHFGDVVTFDTTYRTNLYNLPFGIFVGVNNHFQSIVFGGVLLAHERTEDFEWAFKNFTDMMEGKHPETILTGNDINYFAMPNYNTIYNVLILFQLMAPDQCQAMAAALKSTMPETRHRWCRWHVLRNAKQKIGKTYSKKSDFKKRFHKLITHEVSPAAFEQQWKQLVHEYSLSDNKFMIRAYKFRGMWAKPYFMNIFCAGMTSTQRSESANHMLKRFIPRSAPMHMFVAKFRDFQYDRNEEEDRENHITNQASLALITSVIINEM